MLYMGLKSPFASVSEFCALKPNHLKMDIQLQLAKTNHYCFVTEVPRMADRTSKRGEISFDLAFVCAEHTVPGDKTSEIENVPEDNQTMTLAEFAAWWDKEKEWRVVGS